jgi:hypothetical protein
MDRTYIQTDIGESKAKNFTCTIAATGVAQQIVSGSSPPLGTSAPSLELLMQLDSDQSDPITIGGVGMTAGNSILLYPAAAGQTPDAYHDNPRNLNEVYVMGTIGTVIRCMYYPGP